MLNTLCPSCHQKTTFKGYNHLQYWYCVYCKKPLPLQEIDQLAPNLKNKVQETYPESTHYIKVWGEVRDEREVIIKTPLISQKANHLEKRDKTYGLRIYKNEDFLGELPLERTQ